MNMRIVGLALLLLAAAGCSSAVGEMADLAPEADAGGDVIAPPTSTTTPTGADSAPPPNTDGGAGGAQPEAGRQPEAGKVDSNVPSGDSGAKVDSGNTSPEATPPTPDAGNVPAADSARTDAAPPSSDAATADVDGGNVAPICPAPSPGCDGPNRADGLIRSTFPNACVESTLQCGGVWNGVVETLPMICRFGIWRLAGGWSGAQWVPAYQCSRGCELGKMCNP